MDLEPASWLKAVRAVPTIGIRSTATYESSADLLNLIRPTLSRWAAAAGPLNFVVEPFSVRIEDVNGFATTVSHDNVTVTFVYKAELDSSADFAEGEAPVFHFASPARTIDKIMDDCAKKLLEMVSELQKTKHRKWERFGVVATGMLNPNNPPPGFASFLQHVVKPWQTSESRRAATELSSEGRLAFRINLDRTEGASERCHHLLEWSLELARPKMTFLLDWQRNLSEPKELSSARFNETLDACTTRAYEYFGTFGTGALAYE